MAVIDVQLATSVLKKFHPKFILTEVYDISTTKHIKEVKCVNNYLKECHLSALLKTLYYIQHCKRMENRVSSFPAYALSIVLASPETAKLYVKQVNN